jgi:outer membrane protein assembly factor BamB
MAALALSATVILSQQAATPAPPKLEFAFELHADVGQPVQVGEVPGGQRRIVPVSGGTFSGSGLKGKILPGGADHQLIQPDGFTQLEARYALETDTGEKIYVTNRGMRHGPAEVLQRLNAGERVDQSLIYFRTVATLETAAPKLQWMTRSLFVCVGERYPNDVVVRFYRVL